MTQMSTKQTLSKRIIVNKSIHVNVTHTRMKINKHPLLDKPE